MRRPTSLAVALVLLLSTSAGAAPPKTPSKATASPERAEAAFQDFARDWMDQVRRQGHKQQHSPKVAAGPGNLVFTYRDYAEEFRTEMRTTGQPVAPYVGLLHYTEQVYSCRSLAGLDCTVAATVPVTEIFRYQGGRWSY